LTKDNAAADGAPSFSPDGRWLAYRAQRRPGFEADKWELMVVACDPNGALLDKPRRLTAQVDRSVDDFTWTPDEAGKARIPYAAEDRANTVYSIANLDPNDSYALHWNNLTYAGVQSGLTFSKDGKVRAYLRAALDQPAEVYTEGRTEAFALPARGPGNYQTI